MASGDIMKANPELMLRLGGNYLTIGNDAQQVMDILGPAWPAHFEDIFGRDDLGAQLVAGFGSYLQQYHDAIQSLPDGIRASWDGVQMAGTKFRAMEAENVRRSNFGRP